MWGSKQSPCLVENCLAWGPTSVRHTSLVRWINLIDLVQAQSGQALEIVRKERAVFQPPPQGSNGRSSDRGASQDREQCRGDSFLREQMQLPAVRIHPEAGARGEDRQRPGRMK